MYCCVRRLRSRFYSDPIDHDAIDGLYQIVWRLERDVMARIDRFNANFWKVARYPCIMLGFVPIGSFPPDEGDWTGDLRKSVPRVDIRIFGQRRAWSLRLCIFLIGIPRQDESTIHLPQGKFGALAIQRKAWRVFLLGEMSHRLLDCLGNLWSVPNRDVVVPGIALAHRCIDDDELGQMLRKIGREENSEAA